METRTVTIQKDWKPMQTEIDTRVECWKRTLDHYKTVPEIGSQIFEDIPNYPKDHIPPVEFVKGDCIESAILFVDAGFNPLLLNMSDWRVAGGGVDHGYATQEEELFRRSNYHKHLLQKYYPMSKFRTIVSKKVEFWLGTDYQPLDRPRLIDCVAAPALVGPSLTSDGKGYAKETDLETMEKKIRMLFYAAYQNGNDSLVLSAWGCGAFHCPIHGTAKLFRKVIEEGLPSSIKKIVFAITGNRFEPFQEGFTI